MAAAPMAAMATDVTDILALRDAAAQWHIDQGIRQWTPGEVPAIEIARQVAAQELFVVRDREQLIGAVRITWADPRVWGLDDGAAGYIHGLVVRDREKGLGVALLRWCEEEIVKRGRFLARLDCVASNGRLRSYYHADGYCEAGLFSYPAQLGLPALVRFEKRLREEAV